MSLRETAAGAGHDRGYVDFGAIVAGAVIAAGTTVVLGTFIAGLGLGTFSVGEDGGISVFGLVMTALVSVISLVATYMLGGYIAGRMRRRSDDAGPEEVGTRDGIHGLVVWGLGMLVGGFLAAGAVSDSARAVGNVADSAIGATASAVGGVAQGAGQLAGGVVSGAGQLVGGVVQGAGEAAGPSLESMMPQGLQSNPMDYITDTLLRPNTSRPMMSQSGDAGQDDAQQIAGQISGILMNLLRSGEISDEDQDYLRSLVASRTGLSQSEVDARVDQAIQRTNDVRTAAEEKLTEAKEQAEQLKAEAEQKFEEAKAKAAELAENARIAGILTAFLLAASALVAAAAAFIGAVRGGQHRDEGRVWGGLSYRR